MLKAKQIRKRTPLGRPLQQVAALAYRWSSDGQLEILILSSRDTHRPVIPKGWPIRGRKDWKAAEIEARQEAGVTGEIGRKAIGHYRYWKRLETHFALVKVAVYPLEVRRQLADWRERHERIQTWMSAEDAALLLDEPELSGLITQFARTVKRRPAPGSVRGTPARRTLSAVA